MIIKSCRYLSFNIVYGYINAIINIVPSNNDNENLAQTRLN